VFKGGDDPLVLPDDGLSGREAPEGRFGGHSDRMLTLFDHADGFADEAAGLLHHIDGFDDWM
jgi:hypothetical protein